MNTTTNKSHNRYAYKIAGLATLAVLLFTAGIFNASAQERTLTLDEAVKLGIDNSKALKLSQAKIDQAVSQFNQAKDKSLPTGSASFAYNRAQIPANTLDLGSGDPIHLPTHADAYLGIASLSETIFAGNRLRYARESTDLLVQAARLDADKDKDQIVYDVINNYYSLYKVLQSRKVVDANLQTIDAQIKQAQRFFGQGLVTKNDVLRFQLQRSNIELNGIDLDNNRKIINYNLNILLGLPENTILNIDQIAANDKTLGPLASYIDTALTSRKEIRESDLRTQSAEVNIKSVKANQAPTLAASVGGYYVDVNANPLPKSGQFITPITLGVTFAWHFDALWLNKNKVAEARTQHDQAVINKGIAVDNIKTEVNRDYQNYQNAVNKINLLQTSIAQATENNKILESKYQSNVASATDRADAETLLYQAQINLELAKADAGLAYYTLLKSTGKLTK